MKLSALALLCALLGACTRAPSIPPPSIVTTTSTMLSAPPPPAKPGGSSSSSSRSGSSGSWLRRPAEDRSGLPLLLLRLFLLGVRRDDHALARRELATLEDRLEIIGVEGLAVEERLRDRLDL